jgi:uncharacterized membrane protein YfcA
VSILVCIAAGLIAGLAGGMFGVGGGVIIVPFLILALKFDQHKAQGTSLFSLSLPVAALGMVNYYQEGSVHVMVGLTLAAAMAVGSFLGARFALRLPATTMRRAFCIFISIIAAYLFFKSAILHSQAITELHELPVWAYPACILAGLIAGLTGGLFGVGGGVIVVPFMALALAFPQHLAQGTSLLALTLPVAGFGAYNYWKKGSVDLRSGACVSIGVVFGSFLGSRFALGLDPVTMQQSFAVFVVTMSAYLFFKK